MGFGYCGLCDVCWVLGVVAYWLGVECCGLGVEYWVLWVLRCGLCDVCWVLWVMGWVFGVVGLCCVLSVRCCGL